MLRPHLTAENHETLLEAARHKTKREVEYQVACLAPKVAAKALIRRLPDAQASCVRLTSRDLGAGAGVEPAAIPSSETSVVPWSGFRHVERSSRPASPRPTVAPLASDRFLLRVTLSADAHTKLRRAQDLMRHTIPSGDPAAILEKALAMLVDQLEKAKTAKAARPRGRRPTATNMQAVLVIFPLR